MTTFMSYEGYFYIKGRAPITVIMKLKSMISSTRAYTDFGSYFKFLCLQKRFLVPVQRRDSDSDQMFGWRTKKAS